MKVSLSAVPTILKEQDETTLTLTFKLSEPPPPEGVNVIVDSDVADAIREFDVGGIEVVGGKFPDPNLDASGFEFLITAQTASIKIPVLNDSEVEPTETIQFKLQPGEGYTIDPAADQATLSLVDSPSAGKNVVVLQLVPYTFDGDDKLVASALSKSPEDGTSLLSFVFTADGELPKDGLIVNIDSTVQMRDYFAFLAEKPFMVGGELVGAIFNDAGEATGFKFRMTQSQAILNLRVDADGSKTNEKVNFVVAPGDYSIDAKTRLAPVTFYESLAQVPPTSVSPTVSLGTNTTDLSEATGNSATLTFKLSEAPPPEGVLVYVKGDAVAGFDSGKTTLSEFDLFNAKVTGGAFPVPDSFANGFYFKITEQTATLTLSAFKDEDLEGIKALTLSLQPGTGYAIAPTASSATLRIVDDANSQVQVSFATEPVVLIESEKTVSIHRFNLSAPPPAEGLVVSVVAPNISEFDLSQIVVEGGAIARVTPTGFDLKLTAKNGTIKLPVANDGIAEGLEKASFTIQDAPNYQVNPNAFSGEFQLVDMPDQAPVLQVREPNDIIAKAVSTNLSSTNTKASFKSAIGFGFRNSYDDGKGGTIYVDASEDVDLYKVTLKAGDQLKIDVDANQFEPGAKVDTSVRVFDANGVQVGYGEDGAAPDELFEAKWASYLEFTAPTDGDYYVGVAIYENTKYDPLKPASGSGFSGTQPDDYGTGDYTLNLSLNDPQAFIAQPTAIPRGDGTGPAISLFTVGGTYESDFRGLGFEILAPSLVETTTEGQASALNLVLSAEGEIPEGGVEVYITADQPLLDYFGNRDSFGALLSDKPFTRGGQFLTAIYDGQGTPIGFKFRLEQSFATIVLPAINRPTVETDGAATVTFSVVESQGYRASDQSRSTITFYDNLEQVPVAANLPEVSLVLDRTELVESAETQLTLTLSLKDAPPPEGVQVYVSGNAQDFLNEFNIFDAEFSGGVAVADGAVSGFYFQMFEQKATITLPVFNSADIVEGIEEFNVSLKPGAGYKVNEAKNGGMLKLKDTPDSLVQVSLTTEPEVLIESDGTTAKLNFNLSAVPDQDGLPIIIKTAEMLEFDPKSLTAEGGKLVGASADNTSFTFLIQGKTASVSVKVADDGKAEGVETATFSIDASGIGYQVNPDASSSTFTIVDTADQVPSDGKESNDTLATATVVNSSISAATPIIFEAEIAEHSIEISPDNTLNIDRTEDVDLYKVYLDANQKLTIDVDATEIGSKLQFAQIRVFDEAGKEVLKTGGNYFQAAPAEVFSVFNDTFAEFTATNPGNYYVGISQIGNDYYDPTVAGSGSGWVFPTAEILPDKYKLTLTREPIFIVDPPPLPSPTVAISATPVALNEEAGTSLTLNFSVDGTIPSEGIPIKLTGSSANLLLEFLAGEIEFESPTETEFEFISDLVRAQGLTLGAVDSDFSSFELILNEPQASLTFKVFNDRLEEGNEAFTYTLETPEDGSYAVDSGAKSVNFAISDGVPAGTGSTISMSADQMALYEDESSQINFTFKVQGDIPAGGVTVFVDSIQGYGSIGALGQFDALQAIAQGGKIVDADEDASGFYFTITEPTATLTVPIFSDREVEGSIPYVFAIVDGETYQVDSNQNQVQVIIGDSAPFNIINGTEQAEVLKGTAGKDAIYGLAGNDALKGLAGRDVMVGDAGNDNLDGGEGDDLLSGGTGNNTLIGGSGSDTFILQKGGVATIRDFDRDQLGVVKGEIDPMNLVFEQSDTTVLVKLKSTGETLAKVEHTSSNNFPKAVIEVENQPLTPGNTYLPTILVANRQEYNPQIYDPTFELGWGLAIRPAGFGGHFWVTANGSGASYEYVGDVNIGTPNAVPLYQDDLKLVTVPGSNGTQGTPTGVVFNASDNFVITQAYPGGDVTGPSRFLFATDTGTISAWTERKRPDGGFDRAGEAKIVIDNSERGDQYFGLAVNPTGDRLFVANFGANPNIQVFDGNFKDITTSFNGFANPFVGNDGFQPGEYAPFNVQVLEDKDSASVFVAYAKTQEDPDNPGQLFVGEEEAGSGLGRLAEFDVNGKLVRIWDDEGLLNSPWGVAYAPDSFGGLSNTLLVSNFSDGTITAFDRTTYQAIDWLRDPTGQPLPARGIWGILFGNGASLGDTNSLYAAIGPEDLNDGVFARVNYLPVGQVMPSPEPGNTTRAFFDWTGQIAGFSVKGDFSYDSSKVYEDGIIREEDLLTFNVSFFDAQGNLLKTYENNHLTFADFNFAFDTKSNQILQDGAYFAPDGINIGEKTVVGSGFQGLNFWSRPAFNAQGQVPPPHLHVDDWADEFGFPIGFSTHEEVAFPTRTTAQLLATGRVGATYVNQVQTRLNELGQRARVITSDLNSGMPRPEDVVGTAANDRLWSMGGTFFGLDGDDRLYNNGGISKQFGGAGNDLLYGNSDADILSGGDGNDTLYGNGGMDKLSGDAGNDLIYGGAQVDEILGGAGDDVIYGNGGGDVIDAGSGMDMVWFGAGTGTLRLNTGEGYVTVNNFQLGATKFKVDSPTGLTYADSADGVKISKGDDLLAIVAWQTASTFSSNASMIFG